MFFVLLRKAYLYLVYRGKISKIHPNSLDRQKFISLISPQIYSFFLTNHSKNLEPFPKKIPDEKLKRDCCIYVLDNYSFSTASL